MASLNNLLNPESSYEPSIRLQVLSPTTTSPTISPTERTSESSTTAAELRPPPPRAEVVIRAHEPHPDCPDTLACLPDTDGRPQHTLPVILRCTILGSPRKRLTIREIYAAMERKYPYYKTAGPAWKQSVRHHLSLNRLFERQPRPPSDPGFGSYWTVNLEAPPGTKRPRKRGGRSNKADYAENGTASGARQGPPVMIPMRINNPPPLSVYPSSSMSQMPQSPSVSAIMTTSNGIHSSNNGSMRSLPASHMSHPSPEDHYQTHSHHDSSHSPPQHTYPHTQQQSHTRQHSHIHPQSPLAHSQPPPPHMQSSSSDVHSQPPQHHHSHSHPHSTAASHSHAQPPSHSQSQTSTHPYRHSPTMGHPQSQPPPPPPHPHAHSQAPPSHSSPHYHHQQLHPSTSRQQPPTLQTSSSDVHSNAHSQKSVSTIAKLRPVDSRSFSQPSAMRSRTIYDDDEDDDMDWEDADGPLSDDDYSSSEDMPYQYDPRAHHRNSSSYSGSSHRTYSGSQGQSGRSVLHGAFSGYSNTDHTDPTIDRLKMEMAGLRRQSQDAVNASLRLSDQLTASQDEAARAKAALKVAENMLEEETRRRFQAEKNAEDEARRRRMVEDTLRQYEQARAQRKPNSYARA